MQDLYLLYTSTETGKSTIPRMIMDRQNALKWCNSNYSKGQMFGSNWAYFFTSVQNYISHYNLEDIGIFLEDDGSFDARLKECGVVKMSAKEISKMFFINNIRTKVFMNNLSGSPPTCRVGGLLIYDGSYSKTEKKIIEIKKDSKQMSFDEF